MEDDAVKCLMEQNEREKSLSGSMFLLDLLDDIISNRFTSKYLNIPVRSKIFVEQILPVNGVMECLFSIGYEEGEDSFYLPNHVAVAQIMKLKEKIHSRTETYTAGYPTKKSPNFYFPTSATGYKNETTVLEAACSPSADKCTQRMDASFQAKVIGNANFVLTYEDEALQAKARSLIPTNELRNKAQLNQGQPAVQNRQLHLRDFLLLELLSWFKNSFFKWVDAEVCAQCNVPGVPCGTASPSAQELRWGANRVELLTCPKCNLPIRFPRYNHPGKLLETRRGRCGEWANCFTLCCRALGFEARFVVDWNDHVWTEVYSDSQNRWLHCDPCENVCDKPLLYESGWGKRMNYVLAFSKYEIQDVTWRYSALHEDVLKRRNLCNESHLLETITRITEQRQRTLNDAYRKKLLTRRVTELVEFLSPTKPGEGALGGRTSGSLAWRQARGESQTSPQNAVSYCFTLSESEVANKLLHVTYSPTLDKYVRMTSNSAETVGWQNCMYRCSSLFRKVESDWNMVYLARTPNSNSGSISWKFDFTASGLLVDSLQITCPFSTFENGKVLCTVSNEAQTVALQTDNEIMTVPEMHGSRWFLLKIELSGGLGPVAWQHAQLFRMAMDNTTAPFSIKVFLKPLTTTL